MVAQTSIVFGIDFPFVLYAFVFFGSVCSYNFHWYLTPPNPTEGSYKQRWSISNRHLHLVLFAVGVIGSGVTSLLLLKHWMWLGVTAFLTFLYSAPKIDYPPFVFLRRIAVGKTIFLAFAWTHVTTLLPLLVSDVSLTPEMIWFVVNRFFFLYAICIVFDRRDVESDRKAGIKSLITYLTQKGIDQLFWASLLVVLLTFIILSNWLPVVQLILLAIPAVIMSLLYSYAKKNPSDYLYYFLLDGLMAFSAPMLILAKFAR